MNDARRYIPFCVRFNQTLPLPTHVPRWHLNMLFRTTLHVV